MVTVRDRRRVAEYLKSQDISERSASRVANLSRSTVRRPLRRPNDEALRAKLRQLAEQHPRYGYLTLHAMLRAETLVGNHKRTYRIYREEGLQVRTKKWKKPVRPRVPMAVPTGINERWSVDFVSDQLANGRRFRVSNIVDDFSRKCVLQVVDFSISVQRLTREMDQLAQRRSLLKRIVLDNALPAVSMELMAIQNSSGITRLPSLCSMLG